MCIRDSGKTAGLSRSAELSQVPLLPEELLGQKHLFPEGLSLIHI